MKKLSFALIAIMSLFTFSVLSQSYAITNAKIVTVSGATIEQGTVIVSDGLISAVGSSVKIPADAKVFDGNGLTVYPGFFDANITLGLSTPQPQPRQPGTPPSSSTNSVYPEGLQPEINAFNFLKEGESQFENARNAGFTTVLAIPREGIFNGHSVLFNLAGDNVAEMVVKKDVAQHITFRTVQSGYPSSLMGTFSVLRQMFLDAGRLQDWKKMYEANPNGIKRPEADVSLEALFPVLNRQMPVVFNANTEIEIIRALNLAKEFNLKPIISGGHEAWKVADRLKKADAVVLLSLNFPKKNTTNSPEADPEPMQTLRFRTETPKCAAKLAQAGVKFAFQSGGMPNLNDFLANALKTTENGLSKDDAIRAMTLWPAEVFGVGNRLGSVEAGKIANLIVSRGDIFSKDKFITHIFVDGKLFERKAPPKTETKQPAPGKPAAVAQVGGTWKVTIEAPGQQLPITLVLNQQGDKLNGQMQSAMLGNADIKNGVVSAEGFNFDATVTFGGQSIDLSFNGKVNENQVTGTVSTPMGSVSFSGTKNP